MSGFKCPKCKDGVIDGIDRHTPTRCRRRAFIKSISNFLYFIFATAHRGNKPNPPSYWNKGVPAFIKASRIEVPDKPMCCCYMEFEGETRLVITSPSVMKQLEDNPPPPYWSVAPPYDPIQEKILQKRLAKIRKDGDKL